MEGSREDRGVVEIGDWMCSSIEYIGGDTVMRSEVVMEGDD